MAGGERRGGKGWRRLAAFLVVLAVPARSAPRAISAQAVAFEKTVEELSSDDPRTRLRAVQLLKGAAYPEAAVPLARAVLDPYDETQLEAIAAELNIFLADKVTPRRRVGLLVEVRSRIEAEPIFALGPSAIGPERVPAAVLAALATASRDPNARVAVEALYAFGSLAGDAAAADRPAVLAQAGPLLAATIGATDPMLRLAAIRVIGRVFARRPNDPAIEETVGDAVILALNDRESVIQQTAMWALGMMRYERAVQGLNELFQYHQRGALAERALDALARIGHASSLTTFVAQLSVRNATFRMMAIEGLARVGESARAEAVQRALAAERDAAVLLAGHFANVTLSDGSIDPIVDAITRNRLRDQATQYLLELVAGRSASFARHVQDPAERVRLDVVDILGLSGDPTALPIVEALVTDRDPAVAKAAARAVARLRTSPGA